MNVNSLPDYPVIDGFLLSTKLRCNLTFKSLALQQWEALRRAGSFKTKSWQIPESSEIVIPAHDSYEKEIKAVPGSAIWGFSFTPGSNDGPFSINFRDACTDVDGFSQVCRTDKYTPTTQQPLSRLMVCSAPGLIYVEICSQQASDASGVQLVLWGGEPVC